MVLISIKDNGVDFDINITSNGRGLKNMQTRAANLNGRFNIQSSNISGTNVQLYLPYKLPL